MDLGILSFSHRNASRTQDHWDQEAEQSVADNLQDTLERIKVAEDVGLSFYGLGEHHLPEYSVSSPQMVLAAAASQTSKIRLGSAVSILTTDDPVRLYGQFNTLDQLSGGRAELMVGKGAYTESFHSLE